MLKNLIKLISVVLVLALLSALAACGGESSNSGGSALTPAGSGEASAAAGAKVTRLKFNHTVAETSLWHTYSVKFAELIEQRTDGRYVVDIFPNTQLASGNQAKTIEMLRAGTIDIDLHSTTIWAGLDERFSIVLMPFLYRGYDEVFEFMNGESGEAFMKLVEENGCVPIAFGDDGFREVLSIKGPIKTPADFKDLKIRVPGMTMFVDMYRVLGGDPTTMNWNEVFTSLQQKTIDAMECPPELLETGKFYEVTNYLTVWGGCYDPLIFAMSEKLRDSLSEDDRKIFMDTGKEVMDEQIQAQIEANERSIELMEPHVEVYRLTDEEVAAFVEALKPLYDQYSDKFPEDLRKAMGYDR